LVIELWSVSASRRSTENIEEPVK